MCMTGSALANNPNSVCHEDHCYAKRGWYRSQRVHDAQARRLQLWLRYRETTWIDAMVTVMQGQEHFRWFDSGDLQSIEMLHDICEVCNRTPDTQHYLPTKEYGIMKAFMEGGHKIPDNLSIRVSSPLIDHEFSGLIKREMEHFGGSVVYRYKWPKGFICKASSYNNTCGPCRACWDRTVKVIAYPYHSGKHKAPTDEDYFPSYVRQAEDERLSKE